LRQFTLLVTIHRPLLQWCALTFEWQLLGVTEFRFLQSGSGSCNDCPIARATAFKPGWVPFTLIAEASHLLCVQS